MQQKLRLNWGQSHTVLPELDLIKLQLDSYKEFLGTGIKKALQAVNSENGIEDYTGKNWSFI